MTKKVLILGGQGRIGTQVTADILAHTPATVTQAGRHRRQLLFSQGRCDFLSLDLADQGAVTAAIATHDLVIHCAGPFKYRDRHVLETCLAQGVNYLDVADNPGYVRAALTLCPQAQAAGVTAMVGTGVFPGISNSMVRQGIEQLDQATTIQLNYGVAGSGGAGVTVMRTTFLELQHPFPAWIAGQWQTVKPYSQRQVVTFPPPDGRCGVYWFNTVEAMTLATSFPVETVVTKFGSFPDFYNHLTWLMAHGVPKAWLQQPAMVEFLAQVSYRMTQVTDPISGVGIAMEVHIHGIQNQQPVDYRATFRHGDTAAVAGMGTGSIAQGMLSGALAKPGVWPVEQGLSTALFEATLAERGLTVQSEITPQYS
ncbi:MAG: saccharopine dehydrogenase NADP-binding domain-containing protein [Cyanobacteria bacterium]|nr:saccharopine dehydrogenase NADP-binding domain-containing protein [Cyanobacteriota bacterium]MDA0866038.1 saccharopine dehydrogenase NADP-binding domain-containing protein [Cyanobacteriota bacterium]